MVELALIVVNAASFGRDADRNMYIRLSDDVDDRILVGWYGRKAI